MHAFDNVTFFYTRSFVYEKSNVDNVNCWAIIL